MRSLCAKMGATCIECNVQDSTKIGKASWKLDSFSRRIERWFPCISDFEKYRPNSFDRILLDDKCSDLGQRPLIYNNIDLKQLGSYVSYQRMILENVIYLTWSLISDKQGLSPYYFSLNCSITRLFDCSSLTDTWSILLVQSQSKKMNSR